MRGYAATTLLLKSEEGKEPVVELNRALVRRIGWSRMLLSTRVDSGFWRLYPGYGTNALIGSGEAKDAYGISVWALPFERISCGLY